MMLTDLKNQGKLEPFLPEDLDIFRKILKAQQDHDLRLYQALQSQLTAKQIAAFIRYKDTVNMGTIQSTPSFTTAFAQISDRATVVEEASASDETIMPAKKKRRTCQLL